MTTADQLGRPVAAELSLALVDLSLLRLFGDRMPPIGPFFYNQTRTGAFAHGLDEPVHVRAGDAAGRLGGRRGGRAAAGDGGERQLGRGGPPAGPGGRWPARVPGGSGRMPAAGQA